MARSFIKFSFRRSRPHPYPIQVRILAWFVGGLSLMAGCFCLFTSGSDYRAAKQSADWQKVSGTLLSCDKPAWPHASIMTVKYEYPYAGQMFQGDRICHGIQSARKFFLTRLKTPMPIDVFVNPVTPQESVLYPFMAPGDYGMGMTGVVISFIGILILMFNKERCTNDDGRG